ncbi:hypothetical protein F511_05212 [Dorcoceras hygrometricum]|uniref:S-adenosyl-L-methionine-dependent methyltransferase superfamily protein n=1 Tax=Dorcoceras hygrometricum TaxID=472368 RepID=A0A2Z7CJ61_9LAMI|nr:hypothetical protein F511_05212 [Dorcoceras hygrometricum]
MYVGGRVPLHLQEDFCGTALLSVEWIHGDARRTAVGLDLDVEALNWCIENNVNRIGADICSRITLFHGNVLQPLDSKLINFDDDEIIENTRSEDNGSDPLICTENIMSGGRCEATQSMKETQMPARDIVCAFNYSCCCLHNRKELILYFKHAFNALSKKGGIFVMDLYGGTSSEKELRLQRRFPNFTVSYATKFYILVACQNDKTITNELPKCSPGTELVGIVLITVMYIWEQADFDIIQRKTRISLHFHLQKQHKKLRHAFSYSWRLWSLPEVKDCLEEAGFSAVHIWIRNMPDCEQIRCTDGFFVGRDIKYEEATSFKQQDAWNAYIVGVA